MSSETAADVDSQRISHAADVSIRVDSLSKTFAMFNKPEDRLKQMIVPRIQGMFGLTKSRYYQPFDALKNISFSVSRGQTVGIIGRNGSGKSTLLQIVCGILQPSAGSVQVSGRIAALLELGAGFNPEFTGRENVHLNATLLGMSGAEIADRFGAIVEFADIGDFIDRPVKTYSSGMYIRLAFAIAINAHPEILVVDEALAVGDESFRRKCYARIEDIQSKGATILFVSHGAQTIVQLCSHAILLDRGELLMQGEPKAVTAQYQRLANLPSASASAVREEIRALTNAQQPGTGNGTSGQPTVAPPKTATRFLGAERYDAGLASRSRVEYETRGARIGSVELVNELGAKVNVIEQRRRYRLRYDVLIEEDARDIGVGTLIKSFSGIEIGGTSSNKVAGSKIGTVAAGSHLEVMLEFDCRLTPGVYFLNVGVVGTVGSDERYLHRIVDALAIRVADTEASSATGLIDFDFRHDVRILTGRSPKGVGGESRSRPTRDTLAANERL